MYELLKARGVDAELKVFPQQVHGFHSLFWSYERYDAQAFILNHLRS